MSEHDAPHGGGSDNVVASLLARIGISVDDKGLEGLNHKLKHMQHLLHILTGAALFHAIFSLGERFAGLGESLESAAIQTGLTTDELQKLQYAASQNAISADEMTMGIVRLSRTLYSAQRGSKQAQATFAKIGITPEQLASFSNTKEALYATVDGINTLGTSQEKVGVSMQLLSRGGAKFLKLFDQGSAKIEELGARAERVGAIVSHKNVENLANFEDAFSSFRLVMSRFLANVAGTFVPGITRGLRAIEDAWGQNKDTIMATLKYLGGELSYYLYIATLEFKIFAKIVHQILHGGGGLAGSIHDFLVGIKDDVQPVVESITNAIKEAANNGNFAAILVDLKELVEAIGRAGGAVGTLFSAIGDGFAKLGGIDTNGLSNATNGLNALLAILQAIVGVLRTLFDLIAYNFGGYLVSDLKFLGGAAYEKASGAAKALTLVDESRALKNLINNQATRSDYWQNMTRTFGPDLDAALGKSVVGKLAPPLSLMGGAAPSVTVQSTVNVTVPPGAEASKIAEQVAARQAMELPKAVREAHRDLDDPLHH